MDQSTEKQKVIAYSVDVYITLGLITLFAYYTLRFVTPFISIFAWSAILTVAIHPIYEKLRLAIGGRGGLAAAMIALLGLIILVVPAFFVGQSMINSLGDLSQQLQGEGLTVPPPMESVQTWPLIGERLFAFWSKAHADLGATLGPFAPQIEGFALSLLGTGAGIIGGVLQFSISIIFTAVLLSYSGSLSAGLASIAGRIASVRGRALVGMAGATIRNVSRGILGVAIIQGGFASIGILAVGLPFAGFIAVIAVAACAVQIPLLVLAPTIIYVWSVDTTTVAMIYTVYMIPVLLLDNLLKPILMSRGLETPMIVVLIGVLGGTISAGLMGLFLGPVILALFYKMVQIWIGTHDSANETGGAHSNNP